MTIKTIGLDIAKNIFQLHGVDVNGKTKLRKQLKRDKLLAYFANLTPCLIGFEALDLAKYILASTTKFAYLPRYFIAQL